MSTHLFTEPPSPLTSIPASSPWPTPHRPYGKKLNPQNIKPAKIVFTKSILNRNYRFIQSPHWHLSDARRASSSYRGLHTLDPNRVVFQKDSTAATRLEALKNAGYRLVPFENDGRTTFLTDSGGTCLGCVIPPTLKPEKINSIGEKLQDLENVSNKQAKTPRGTFKIVTHGIQMGSGSKTPSPCFQKKSEKLAAQAFFLDTNVKRHLHQVGNTFRTHFPVLHRYYWKTLGLVSPLVYDGTAPSNQVPFACFTLNVGSQSVSGAHVDCQNLPCGLCLVSPFGNFDFRKGGHLILHELKLVLEVPPGASVLFPSAIITHENIPIAEGEFRRSITGFSPGALFRWVDKGFRRANEIRPNKKKRCRKTVCEKACSLKQTNVWAAMTRLFPHITHMD